MRKMSGKTGCRDRRWSIGGKDEKGPWQEWDRWEKARWGQGRKETGEGEKRLLRKEGRRGGKKMRAERQM